MPLRRALASLVLIGTACAAAPEICDDPIVPDVAALHSSSAGARTALAEYLSSVGKTGLFGDCRSEGSYRYYSNWYASELNRKRLSAHVAAVIIVVIGASLPVVALIERWEKLRKLWPPLAGAAIVAVQGLAQTFQLDESRRGFMLAKLNLESAEHAWQMAIVDASFEPDEARALQRAREATRTFGDEVSRTVRTETQAYFDTAQKARPH